MSSCCAFLAGVFLSASAPAGAPGPAAIFDKIGVVEHLNEPIPTALSFHDSTGKTVRLADFFHDGKPVLLTLVYFRCPMLCSQVLTGLTRSLRDSGMNLGEDYRVITVSVDPSDAPDDAAEKKRGHLQALGVQTDNPNWGFLTGADEDITTLANAVGFQYAYDGQSKQFAHEAVVFVLTPEGKISRYLYGIEFPSRDLRLAMVEATGGKVGTSLDRVLLTCYQYDPATRRYGWVVKGVLRTGGFLVFLGLAGMLGVLWRRDFKRGTVA